MTILNLFAGRTESPGIQRVRHEARRRVARVERVERVTPAMLRMTLGGDDLAGFHSLGFDDHLKLFVPGSEERRDYTPRRQDPVAGTLTIDFALHEAGPITRWAMAAKPGDIAEFGGPKGSAIVSADVRRWLLVGDETALPAIGRRIEEADAASEIDAVVAVSGPENEQPFETSAALRMRWVHRTVVAAADPSALVDAVREVDIRPDTFVWVAAEATVARAVRDYVVGERGHPQGWIKAGGYWVSGQPAGKQRIG